jgi:hypothetical protein
MKLSQLEGMQEHPVKVDMQLQLVRILLNTSKAIIQLHLVIKLVGCIKVYSP